MDTTPGHHRDANRFPPDHHVLGTDRHDDADGAHGKPAAFGEQPGRPLGLVLGVAEVGMTLAIDEERLAGHPDLGPGVMLRV